MPDALIWGASGGIGGAVVRHFKEAGWRVFAAARHEENIPPEADFTYHFDATDPQSADQVALLVSQEIEETLDLIVYAAGGVVSGKLDRLDADAWTQSSAANLDGAVRAANASLNLLSKHGHMVFIGAYVEKITLPKMGAYATAKAGLQTMVEILRKENRRRKITLVRPPAVDTPFWENVPFSLPDSAITPDAVASAIVEHVNADKDGMLDL